MKYCVMSSLSFVVPAQRDQLYDAILARIGNKPVWRTVGISKGLDMDGSPRCSLEVRFNQKADMSETFVFIKQRMDAIPVLKGSVSIHECSHDEGTPRACVLEDQHIK